MQRTRLILLGLCAGILATLAFVFVAARETQAGYFAGFEKGQRDGEDRGWAEAFHKNLEPENSAKNRDYRAKAIEALARNPDFGATRKSGSEVLRIADEYLGKSGSRPETLEAPIISLRKSGELLEWHLTYWPKGIKVPGNFFALSIDDKTGEVKVHPGL